MKTDNSEQKYDSKTESRKQYDCQNKENETIALFVSSNLKVLSFLINKHDFTNKYTNGE